LKNLQQWVDFINTTLHPSLSGLRPAWLRGFGQPALFDMGGQRYSQRRAVACPPKHFAKADGRPSSSCIIGADLLVLALLAAFLRDFNAENRTISHHIAPFEVLRAAQGV
jgi:hypothetical protein